MHFPVSVQISLFTFFDTSDKYFVQKNHINKSEINISRFLTELFIINIIEYIIDAEDIKI